MFYIGLYREKYEKIFLSETTRPRVMIFGMKHHLVNLNQVCSNYIHGAKNGLPRGSHVLHRLILGKHEKIFMSETTRLRALILICSIIDLYQVCSNYAPRAKNGPAPGVTCFT